MQIAGYAYRVGAEAILAEFNKGGAMRRVLLRYIQALITQMSQTAVCNRHHTVEQRLCPRDGHAAAARSLQALGLIRYARGHITVLDRAALEAHACECYAVVKRETDRLQAS